MKSSYKLCILYFTYYTSINVHIIYNVFISVNQYFYEAKKICITCNNLPQINFVAKNHRFLLFHQ